MGVMVAETGYTAVPSTWVGSGHGMIDTSETLASAVDTLCHALASAGECWGADDIGRAFFNGEGKTPGFGTSRDTVLADLADMVNVVRATGGLLTVAGHTYSVAEAASNVGSALPEHADQKAVAAVDPYYLPEVSQTLAKSDPPPSEFMQILGLLEMLVGGCQWPDGSMSGLASMRDAFHAAASSVNSVAEEVGGHARTVTTDNAGEATENFASFAAALQGGGDAGGLRWLAEACQGLGDSTDFLLKQKNAARMQFTLSLAFLAATWVIALAVSWITAGSSVAGATATTEAEGFVLRTFLQGVRKAVLTGLWFGGGLDAVGQYARIHEGVQKDFSLTELAKASGEGALAGGVMGAAGGWVAQSGNRFATVLSGYMKAGGLKGTVLHYGFSGTTATAGNVAAQAAFDHGHVDLAQAAQFGFGMVGMEAFKDAGRHAGSHFGGGQAPPSAIAETGAPLTDPVHTDVPVSSPHDTPTNGGQPGPGGRTVSADYSPSGDRGPVDTPPAGQSHDVSPGGPVHDTRLAGTDVQEQPPAHDSGGVHPAGQNVANARGSAPVPRGEAEGPVVMGTSSHGGEPVPGGASGREGGRPSVADLLQGKTAPSARAGSTGRGPVEGQVRSGDVVPPESRTAPRTAEPVHDTPVRRDESTPPGAERRAEPPGRGTPTGGEQNASGHGTQPSGRPAEPAAPTRTGEPRPPENLPPGGKAPESPQNVASGAAEPTGHQAAPRQGTEGGTAGRGPANHEDLAAAVIPAQEHGSGVSGPPRAEPPAGHSTASSETSPASRNESSAPPHEPTAPSPEANGGHRPALGRDAEGRHILDRTHLDGALRHAGYADPVPAPEVHPQALRDLRPAGQSGTRGEPRAADPVRLAADLRDVLRAPTVEGGDLLARLHELRQDPAAAHRLGDAYRQATGRDLRSDIEQARSDGRLDFDPEPYLQHLLPDPMTAQRLAHEGAYTDPGDPRFTRDLHDAIEAGDGPRVGELLNRTGRSPEHNWRLQDAYRAHHGKDPLEHIQDRFGESGETHYLSHLMGDGHLETRVLSVAEAKDLYDRLSVQTFRTQGGSEARIPFGHPEDGCYDRAHRMAMKLSEWGYSSRKVFAIRTDPSLQVQADTAAGASWGRPGDVRWGYHVAPVVEVRHPNGYVHEVVMDPSLRRGALGVDEWLGLMGMTRNDYLRFDTTGRLPDHVGQIVDGLLGRQVTSSTGLVYTTPRENYWPNAPMDLTLRHAAGEAHWNQARIEQYARVSEARDLGNHIEYSAYSNGPQRLDAAANQIAHKIIEDPAYRMLLDDARAGRQWPPDVVSTGDPGSMALRVEVAQRAYNMVLRSMPGPGAGPPHVNPQGDH
ncbi:MAG: hypothetical protein JWP48_229 [Actinoallomurus sp.]|nr:hypothetical protein [Actinoallomurus sp.]